MAHLVMSVHGPINDFSLMMSKSLFQLGLHGTTTEAGQQTEQEQVMETQLANTELM